MTCRRRQRGRALAAVILAVLPTPAATALETDQFTVPGAPLVDVGGEVDRLVWETIIEVVNDINARAARHRRNAALSDAAAGRAWQLRAAQVITTPDHLRRSIHRRLGLGSPEARIEHLVRELAAANASGPALHVVPVDRSVYRGTVLARPLMGLGIVPTVRLHDVRVGTDKLGHMFQQGHEYLEVLRRAEREGLPPAEALRHAVARGVAQEAGIYGYVPSGAYSNADLAANYAGLLFYMNLSRPVRIGERVLPPLLVGDREGWRLNPRASDRYGTGLLVPFISPHLDESRNPPRLDWTIRGTVEDEIRHRGPRWLAFHRSDLAAEATRLESMTTWRGAAYGHSGWEGVVTVVSAMNGGSDEAARRRGDGRTDVGSR